tara:strand:- start:37 stop:771 length:735 start_codon:yes stop_codon:yes gene_type:complete
MNYDGIIPKKEISDTVIILAGGFGTRLGSITSQCPKPMLEVQDKPFLEHLLIGLEKKGIKKVIFAVSYLYNDIINYFGKEYKSLNISYSIEPEPLGTGGALIKALEKVTCNNVWLLNGDTLFLSSCKVSIETIIKKEWEIIIFSSKVAKNTRYSTIKIDKTNKVKGIRFNDKTSGIINIGSYLINSEIMYHYDIENLSLENNIIPQLIKKGTVYSRVIEKGAFIDIGIEEDLKLANKDILYNIG